ncbi:MAG: WG repeat-containing protein [Prevotella sp.]|nr:WG repeat-containing protein [Prevotella sp.]
MELSTSEMLFDTKEGDLFFFENAYSSKIGIKNNTNHVSLAPFIDYAITFSQFILIKVGENWGVLDNELHTIIPTAFSCLYPVKQIEFSQYIKDKKYEKYIEFEKEYYENEGTIFFLSKDRDDIVNGNERVPDRLFEVIDVSKESPSYFIADRKYLLSLTGEFVDKVYDRLRRDFFSIEKKDSDFFLFHSEKAFSFATADSTGFKLINIGRKIVGKWSSYVNVTYFKEFHKYNQGNYYSIYYDSWSLVVKKQDEKTSKLKFDKVVDFAFTEAPIQTSNSNMFIGRYKKHYFVFGDHINDSKIAKIVTFENHEFEEFVNKNFSYFCNVISPLYEDIEERPDHFFNIKTDSGWGLMDQNMKILIVPQYLEKIEDISNFIIISTDNGCGVVDFNGKTIIPCKYYRIHIKTRGSAIWSSIATGYNSFDESSDIEYFIENINERITESDTGIIIGINIKEGVALCDIYFSDGSFLCSAKIQHSGLIHYIKSKQTIQIEEEVSFDDVGNKDSFGIQFYNIPNKILTPKFEDASVIDSSYLFVLENNYLGLKSFENITQWLLPAFFDFATFPIDGYFIAYTKMSNSINCILMRIRQSYYIEKCLSFSIKKLSFKDSIINASVKQILQSDLPESIKSIFGEIKFFKFFPKIP